MTSTNRVVANAMAAVRRMARNAAEIIIRPSPSADTRSADHVVTEDELRESTQMHIDDVKRGMEWLAGLLREAGGRHDWTKLRYFPSFYRQFSEAQKTGCWGNGWYDRIHLKKERHHLEDGGPADVTLLDVLEHIVDGVMAGKAGSGEYRQDVLGAGLLERAYANTQKMIADAVEVKGRVALNSEQTAHNMSAQKAVSMIEMEIGLDDSDAENLLAQYGDLIRRELGKRVYRDLMDRAANG
jgi:hypothetical protein